jgi:hypothetical protein
MKLLVPRLTSEAGAAAKAKAAGYGGIAAASRVTKLARSTIGRGAKDLRDPGSLGRKVRRKGGGSPRLATRDPTLLVDLERLLEPATTTVAMGLQEPRQAGPDFNRV